VRALVYDGGLALVEEYADPAPGEGEALIDVLLAGICNTDLEIMRGYMGFRGVLGHEFVGLVREAPDASWVGQRVVGEINCACGTCATCLRGDCTHCPNRTTLGIDRRDGTMAQRFVLPLRNLHRVPDEIGDQQAVFAEPLAAAIEITERIHVRPTERVVVIGDGKLGLLVAQVLRLTGCALAVVGRHRSKLSILGRQGVQTFLESDAAAKALEPASADVVVDCTGHAAGFALARTLVRPRGRIVLKSTFHGDNQVNLTALVVDEVTLVGSRCGPFAPALRLLAQGLIDVDSMVEAIYPLDQGRAAFERAATRGALKVLIEPQVGTDLRGL
jgi:alcohol dehydrogenase